jgi:hypothetical protein
MAERVEAGDVAKARVDGARVHLADRISPVTTRLRDRPRASNSTAQFPLAKGANRVAPTFRGAVVLDHDVDLASEEPLPTPEQPACLRFGQPRVIAPEAQERSCGGHAIPTAFRAGEKSRRIAALAVGHRVVGVRDGAVPATLMQQLIPMAVVCIIRVATLAAVGLSRAGPPTSLPAASAQPVSRPRPR